MNLRFAKTPRTNIKTIAQSAGYVIVIPYMDSSVHTNKLLIRLKTRTYQRQKPGALGYGVGVLGCEAWIGDRVD